MQTQQIVLEKLLNPQELTKALADNSITTLTDDECFEYLTQQSLLLILDWSGEVENYELVSFLQTRLEALSTEKIILERDSVYSDFEEVELIKRGMFILFALNYYDEILREAGFAISLMDSGGDVYYVVLSTTEAAAELIQIEDESWYFCSVSECF